jgi:hypothetical protein
MIEARVPDYDYEGKLKSLLLRLAEKGRRDDVFLYAEKLGRGLGMQDVFDQLTRKKPTQ